MIKTLICVSNYGNKQRDLLHRMLATYDTLAPEYDVDVLLLSTENIEGIHEQYPTLNITEKIFNPDKCGCIGAHHKPYFRDHKDEYDLFMFTENDSDMSKDQFNLFMEYSETFKHTKDVLGFIRYEVEPDEPHDWYMMDCGNKGEHLLTARFEFNGDDLGVFENCHQGCYMLTKDKLNYAIDNGFMSAKFWMGGAVENASSSIWAILKRVIPLNRIDDVLINHMSNYICFRPGMNKCNRTLTELKRDLK